MPTYDPAQSHDQNLKTVIVENPLAAITFAMPKCAGFFKHEPEIIAIREETAKKFFAESFVRMDVPLLVKYDEAAFTFLIEHLHDASKFSIHHLAHYVSFLEEEHKRDVIPIVYFPYASSQNRNILRATKSSFMGKRYHYFTYEPVFLKDKPAKKHLTSDNIIARLMLPFMRYSKNDWLEVLDSALTAVWKLVAPTEGLRQNKYLDFLVYYFNLGGEEWKAYHAYKQGKKEKEFEMITTILREQMREQVQQEVREQAEATGKLAEGQRLLHLLFAKRFGPAPAEIESSIRAIDNLDRIESVVTRFMEIRDWQEVAQLLKDKQNN
jgi:hypothetical protein